jgi:predicted HNH restriction endonuclease
VDREITQLFIEKKSLIAEWVTNYHIDKNISVVVLCAGCHDIEHGIGRE